MSDQLIMDQLRAATREHEEWAALAAPFGDATVGIHLAVMAEPFLSYLLNGLKTIESRFSKNAIAPFGRVAIGDLVILKAGPAVGSFEVASAEFITLAGGELAPLRRKYSTAICAEDDEFWNTRVDKRYVTLTGVSDARTLPPVTVSKRDRRGWVVLRAAELNPADDLLSLL